jgi:hypothetical protein
VTFIYRHAAREGRIYEIHRAGYQALATGVRVRASERFGGEAVDGPGNPACYGDAAIAEGVEPLEIWPVTFELPGE